MKHIEARHLKAGDIFYLGGARVVANDIYLTSGQVYIDYSYPGRVERYDWTVPPETLVSFDDTPEPNSKLPKFDLGVCPTEEQHPCVGLPRYIEKTEALVERWREALVAYFPEMLTRGYLLLDRRPTDYGPEIVLTFMPAWDSTELHLSYPHGWYGDYLVKNLPKTWREAEIGCESQAAKKRAEMDAMFEMKEKEGRIQIRDGELHNHLSKTAQRKHVPINQIAPHLNDPNYI